MRNNIGKLIDSLKYEIRQISDLLEVLSEVNYSYSLKELSPISSHVRHVIGFIDTLCNSYESGVIDYDNRPRGTDIEINKNAALLQCSMLLPKLDRIENDGTDYKLKVIEAIDADSSPIVSSTLERELMFLISHTTHHSGIIGIMCRVMDIETPANFGKAQSTVNYENTING